MVVCNNIPMVPAASATCPTTPAAMLPYPQGLCSVHPVPIPCNEYPVLLQNGHYLTSVPVSQIVSCNQTNSQRPNSTGSLPENTASNLYMCDGYYTSNLVQCTPVPLTSAVQAAQQFSVPYNQIVPPSTMIQYSPKTSITNNQSNPTRSVSSAVHCNQAIYANPPPALVPCTPTTVNGPPVLQCSPEVCQIASQPSAFILPRNFEMYPVQTSQVFTNNVTPAQAIPPPLCSVPAASSWKQSYGMEQVWQHYFRCLFNHYAPHVWTLLPVADQPEGHWNSCIDSAKVRFCCEDCGHGWTSMKGRVGFWFVLNPITGQGLVCLKLYGQKCDRCVTRNFEPAMWYPEEVGKVIANIYHKVGESYYGLQQQPLYRERRAGKPRTPHNSDLCQACKDNVCSERR